MVGIELWESTFSNDWFDLVFESESGIVITLRLLNEIIWWGLSVEWESWGVIVSDGSDIGVI